MDAADRNLFQIYQSERPDLNQVRWLMLQVMECVQHLHEKGLVHGNIKMTKIVRLPLDNRLRLIDLDSAVKISEFGGEASYVGSKFSSAVLPPECFAKLDADQVAQFETYFEGVDAELREKVAPKVDKRGASYVVKTFLVEDGRPKNSGDLPYTLVEASEAVDYWSLGALLFQLVAGEPLVPSNRDDDCVNARSMAILASWNDDAAKRNLAVIKDAAAWDLASKLLVRDPMERANFSIADALARHPFFHPESGDADAEIKKQLDAMQQTLNSVKASSQNAANILDRFINGELSMADADENAKKAFFDGAIQNPLFADDIRELVAKQPAVADWADASGRRAIELACLECREAMQRALDDVSEQVAKARALNDNARGIDRFGYRVYAKALHTIIDEAGAEPPVCVGLYAKWGSGKTFLINCIKQAFDPGKMYGVKEDLTTHDMKQWFEREIATPEDATKDKERMEMSYCAYTREMMRPRCEQLARVLVGVSFPAPLWAEALARVATEMFEDMFSGKTFEGLREFAPRELAAVERCARPGCGRAVRQALIWGVVGAVVVVQLGVNVNVSRKFPGDAMPSRLFVFVLALVGFVLGAVASIAYTCRLTNLLCRICRNTKVAPQPEPEPEPETEYIFVDYNAWEYAGSDELWTGLIRNIYEQVEKRIERGPHKPCDSPDRTSGSERNLKREWRVKSAVRLLKKEYGIAGLRARVLLLLAVAAGVVAVVVCEAVGASHLLDALVRARRDAASAARVIAGGVAALAAAVSSARLATRSSRSAGSRGSAIFEEAKSVKDQLGFMSKCKEELNELFRFLRELRDEHKVKLVIVAFVDDLDRCLGGRNVKVLEAIQLILSVPGAPVIAFLAIDSRIVVASIEQSFGEVFRSAFISGWEYLDKIVQIPFSLPPPPPPKLKRLVKSCLDAKGAKPCETLRRFCKFAELAKVGCPEFNDYCLSLSSKERQSALDQKPRLVIKWKGEEIPGSAEKLKICILLKLDKWSEAVKSNDDKGCEEFVLDAAEVLSGQERKTFEDMCDGLGEEGMEIVCRHMGKCIADSQWLMPKEVPKKSFEGDKASSEGRIASSSTSTPLEADFAALRTLRDDDASGALKEFFGDGEDPREWKYQYGNDVTVKDGRVTELSLCGCRNLTALPAAIGELKALTTLNLDGCKSLVELPDAIGRLGALTKLSLYKCSSLAALPAAIGGLKALTELALNGCSSLVELPAAIGELGALLELHLYGCSKLAELPAAIGKLGALKLLNLRKCSSLTSPPEEMRGNVHKTVGFCCLNLLEGGDVSAADVEKSIVSHVIFEDAHAERVDALVQKDPTFADIYKAAKEQLEKDFAGLRKLRDDDESGALKEYFGDGEDPRKWKDEDGDEVVTVADGRVTKLSLYKCSKLMAPPAAIGELGALTELRLIGCFSLAALPAAIGELGALTKLVLHECTKLTALPAAIGALGALTTLILIGCSSLAALPDAIGKLGALTELNLQGCSSLAALPDAIGELRALTMLDLMFCSSLAALPESIAGLDALTTLRLCGCQKLTFPPQNLQNTGDNFSDDVQAIDRIKRLLANTTRLLDGDLSAIDADEVKTGFFEGVIAAPSYADRLEEAVRKDPALTKITNAKGERAIDLACTDCRRSMQQALRQRFEREIGPIISSKDTATNVVTESDLKLFTSLMDAVDPNPRRIKRVVNILQVINSVARNTLVDDEDVERGFIDKKDKDCRWDQFRSKLIKWVILAECYPYRVSLLVLQILDREQKAMVNESVELWSEAERADLGLFQYRQGGRCGGADDPALDDKAVASAVFFEHVEKKVYTHRSSAKMLRLDGDAEVFALLLSKPIEIRDDAANQHVKLDIRMEDILGPKVLADDKTTERDHKFSLLTYSFNLNPALRDQLGQELAGFVSSYEMYADSSKKTALQENSLARKADMLMRRRGGDSYAALRDS